MLEYVHFDIEVFGSEGKLSSLKELMCVIDRQDCDGIEGTFMKKIHNFSQNQVSRFNQILTQSSADPNSFNEFLNPTSGLSNSGFLPSQSHYF